MVKITIIMVITVSTEPLIQSQILQTTMVATGGPLTPAEGFSKGAPENILCGVHRVLNGPQNAKHARTLSRRFDISFRNQLTSWGAGHTTSLHAWPLSGRADGLKPVPWSFNLGLKPGGSWVVISGVISPLNKGHKCSCLTYNPTYHYPWRVQGYRS